MIEVELVTDPRSLVERTPEWRELLADSRSNEPVLTPEWLLTWWDVFGPQQGRRLCSLLFRHQGQLIGLAPLSRRWHCYPPGLPFRRLECLACGEREQDAICSDYVNILARRGSEEAVALRLVELLVQGELSAWDELVIPHMDGGGPMPSLLVGAAHAAGLEATIAETARAPYIPLPGSWQEYLHQVGQRNRYLIRRSLREFDAWAGGTDRLMRATTEAELIEGKRILHQLHQERWGESAGVFRSRSFLTFHDRLMPLFLARGRLELLWLAVHGKPVAALYNLVHDGKTHFYQCGRSLEVPGKIRPGGVLMYRAIQLAIEQGRREFDFLAGESRYKNELALASRPVVQLRLARRRLVEGCRQMYEKGKDLVRPLWRRWRKVQAKREARENSAGTKKPPAQSGEKVDLSLTEQGS